MKDEFAVEYFSGSSDGEIRKLLCSKCRVKTNHTVKHSYRQKWSEIPEGIAGMDDFLIVQCNGCDALQFCRVSSNSEDIDDTYNEKGELTGFYYPETEEQFPAVNKVYEEPLSFVSMPLEVKKAYMETYLALANNLPKLSSIGIRLILELICLSKKINQGTLKQKINELKKQQIISEEMKNLLQKVRIFGNDGAHTKNLPGAEDLKAAWIAINTLIRYIYGTQDTKNYFLAKSKGIKF